MASGLRRSRRRRPGSPRATGRGPAPRPIGRKCERPKNSYPFAPGTAALDAFVRYERSFLLLTYCSASRTIPLQSHRFNVCGREAECRRAPEAPRQPRAQGRRAGSGASTRADSRRPPGPRHRRSRPRTPSGAGHADGPTTDGSHARRTMGRARRRSAGCRDRDPRHRWCRRRDASRAWPEVDDGDPGPGDRARQHRDRTRRRGRRGGGARRRRHGGGRLGSRGRGRRRGTSRGGRRRSRRRRVGDRLNDRYHRHRALPGDDLHLGRVVAPGDASDLHLPDDLIGHRPRASCRRCGRAGRHVEHLIGGDRLRRLLDLLRVGAIEDAADLKLPRSLLGLGDRRGAGVASRRSRRVDDLNGGTVWEAFCSLPEAVGPPV